MSIETTIARINELYRKKQSVGLTEAEAEEQQQLRKIYLTAIKKSLREQLDKIEFVDEDNDKPLH